ncbi:6590_t:CDS:2, partial [Diversispora eburnea]
PSCPNSVATRQEKDSKITVGYVDGYNFNYNFKPSELPWNITYMNWIAFEPSSESNKKIPISDSHTYLNKTVQYRNVNKIKPFASNKTERDSFVSNVINFVHKFELDGVDLEYPDRYGCGKWNNSENFIPLVDELSSALKVINKTFSITVGNNPIQGLNINSIEFINVMPFRQNEISNTTGPSITLDQISDTMDGWSKTVESKKLILGVSLYGVIELTMPMEGSLESNRTVPLDTTANIKYSVFDSYSYSTSSYYDTCSFLEVDYLNLGSCAVIRSKNGPLSSSCTAQNGWTRVFDDNVKSTYLYKVYNTSVVVGSPNPLTTYYYVTYEDSQSIQHKLKLIIDKSYGGIALYGLGDSCDDIISSVDSIFTLEGFDPPKSGMSTLSIILVVIGCIIFIVIAGGGGTIYVDKRGRKYVRKYC